MSPGVTHVTLHADSIVHESDHTDTLQAVSGGASSSKPRSSSSISEDREDSPQGITITAENELIALQVQAFLQASEDVDVDQDVIEDIIRVLVVDDGEDIVEGDGGEQIPGSEVQIDDELMEEDDGGEDGNVEDLAVPSGRSGAQASSSADTDRTEEPPWTKQEIRAMTHLLKERGPPEFINEYVRLRNIPVPKLLKAFGVDLCPELQNLQPKTMLYFLRVTMNHVLQKREKLPQYNTFHDAVQLIRKSQRILILTGAGISVSCGIPDFRSKDGLYASLKHKVEYELDDPQQMFDIDYFRENPAVFYSFASSIYPSNFTPSPCHRFIKLIEDQGKLLRNYTQNIDTLETQVGVQKVLQCHGSFATASCLECRRRVPGKDIEADILNQIVPLCVVCAAAQAEIAGEAAKSKSKVGGKNGKKKKKRSSNVWEEDDEEEEEDVPLYPPGIMKPDITFFGEKLTDDFDHSLAEDRFKVDLLFVIGTSLKVAPVSDILTHLPHSIPQILINKTPIKHINPDIILLGNADDIVLYLCEQLQWELPPSRPDQPSDSKTNIKRRATTDHDNETHSEPPQRVGESHVWLFEGAEGGKWLQQLQKELEISVPPSVPPSAPGSGLNSRSSTPAISTPTKSFDNGSAKRETKKQRVS